MGLKGASSPVKKGWARGRRETPPSMNGLAYVVVRTGGAGGAASGRRLRALARREPNPVGARRASEKSRISVAGFSAEPRDEDAEGGVVAVALGVVGEDISLLDGGERCYADACDDVESGREKMMSRCRG
jgi:hypothetical protein